MSEYNIDGENIGFRDSQYLVDKIVKNKAVERIRNITDTADAVLMALVHIHADKVKGKRLYDRWKKRLNKTIMKLERPEYYEKQATIWDKMKKNKSYIIN